MEMDKGIPITSTSLPAVGMQLMAKQDVAKNNVVQEFIVLHLLARWISFYVYLSQKSRIKSLSNKCWTCVGSGVDSFATFGNH